MNKSPYTSLPKTCLRWAGVGLLALASWMAHGAELKILVDASTEMPLAQFRGQEVVGGVHFEVGAAIAKRLGRDASFISLPRKRVADALANGIADVSCQLLPEWLPGNYDWTIPFMPDAELLIGNASAPRPKDIRSLSGVKIGTILGFAYPEIEKALGTGFVRDDAPTATNNLNKLVAGRMQYAAVGELLLSYQKKIGAFHLALHPAIVVQRYKAQCAVSKVGTVSVTELNKVIVEMERSKELAAIYSHFR